MHLSLTHLSALLISAEFGFSFLKNEKALAHRSPQGKEMNHPQSSSTAKRFALCAIAASSLGIMVFSNIAWADNPVLIPKPAPHNTQGQEAGWGADIEGDYSLMGAYMLGDRFADSGGGYLFENGNNVPRQTFRLTGGVTLNHTNYGIGGDGTVFASSPTPCQFTAEQVNGAHLGDRAAISSSWVALSSHSLGHAANPPHQIANCAGESGTVPAVFLAKRNASGSAFPYGALNYNFSVPFRDRVRAMDVSDTDLVLVGDGNGAHIFSYDAAQDKWAFNRTALFSIDLEPDFGQTVSIDEDTIVIGSKATREIYVYRKQGSTWSFLAKQTSTHQDFGRAVDVQDDLIAVGSGVGVHFYAINGSNLQHINSIEGNGVRLVAINGEYAAGVEDNFQGFVWQYHNDPSEGGYYKSGSMGGGPVDPSGNAQAWFPNNLNIDGIRMLAGDKGYGNGTNQLIGSVIFDSIRPLFLGNNTIDNAEGDRLWRNAGKFDWQRHHGATPSSGTGPSGGAGGSQNYYFVETSQGEGAYYSGDTAILESDLVQSRGRLDFDFHMDGTDIGKLYVEAFYNNAWRQLLMLDGQLSWLRGNGWQKRGVDLNDPTLPSYVKLRFRYVADGGWLGDVGLDNIIINRN